MEDKVKEELEELIKEGETFNGKFNLNPSKYGLVFYSLPNGMEPLYKEWLENVDLWTNNNYNNKSKSVSDLKRSINATKSQNQHDSMMAMLKSMLKYPQKKRPSMTEDKKESQPTNIFNINQSQSQSQNIVVNAFIKAIDEELAEEQAQELKSILDEHKGDIEKAKPKLKEKLLSFGGNVLSGIITNILTNPTLLGIF